MCVFPKSEKILFHAYPVFLFFYGEKASPAPRQILSKLEVEIIFIYSSQFNNFLYTQSLQLCLTLCDPMDCSPPNSPVHGILQARILEWIAIPSSRVSSWLRDWTHISWVSCIAGGFFTHWATREAHIIYCMIVIEHLRNILLIFFRIILEIIITIDLKIIILLGYFVIRL